MKRKMLMVRTVDDHVRAVLTNKYKPFDNVYILSALFPLIEKHLADNSIKIVSRSLSEESFYLQIIFPSIQAEIEKDDICQAGITIRNSEVGLSYLDISTFIYRLVCKNGMKGEEILRKMHVGNRVLFEQEDFFEDDTIKAETTSLKLKLRDTINFAFQEEHFRSIIEKIIYKKNDPIEDPVATIKNLGKRFSLHTTEQKIISRNLNQEKLNRWGLINSITALGHQIDDIERQHAMETIGKNVLDLNQTEWKQLTN